MPSIEQTICLAAENHRQPASSDPCPRRPAQSGGVPQDAQQPARGIGPLRNGNPRGNPNTAPRCGARTRSGCPCKAPAVRGKLRCRMHGGASTGPRTAEGMQRLRAARTIHGRYAATACALHQNGLIAIRRAQVADQALRLYPWLPPQARARLDAAPPELMLLPGPVPRNPPPNRAQRRTLAEREAEALAPWQRAIALARACRHLPKFQVGHDAAIDALFAALPCPTAVRSGDGQEPPPARTGAFPAKPHAP